MSKDGTKQGRYSSRRMALVCAATTVVLTSAQVWQWQRLAEQRLQQQSSLATTLADHRSERLRQTVERLLALPHMAFALIPDGGETESLALHVTQKMRRLVGPSVRLELQAEERAEVPAGQTPRLPPKRELRLAGAPTLFAQGNELLLVQSLLHIRNGSDHQWGYLTLHIPTDQLVTESSLDELPLHGQAVRLSFASDLMAPSVTLYAAGTPASGVQVRHIPFSQGSHLSLEIAPTLASRGGREWPWWPGALLTLAGAFLFWPRRMPPRHESAPAVLPAPTSRPTNPLLEEHLERSHMMFDSLLESFPGLLIIKRASDLRISRINRAGEALLGRPRNGLIGRSNEEIYPPDFAERMERSDRQALASDEIVELPVERLELPGQPVRWLHYRKLTLRNRQGQPQYVLEFGEDISERYQAEHRVAQLNRILAVHGEVSQLILKSEERDELLERVGRLLHEKGGFRFLWIADDTVGGEPRFFGAAEIAEIVRRLYAAIVSPQRRCAGQLRLICRRLDCCDPVAARELERIGLSAMIQLPLEYLGAPHGAIGILGSEEILLDEDAQRLLDELAANLSHALGALEQQRARRTAEEKFQLAARIFEHNAEGIIVTDADNRIVMVNRAFTLVTGYTPEEVLGQNPKILSSGQQDPAFYREMWLALRERGEWHGEIINRRKSGELYHEWLTISAVRNEAGETTNYVAVFSDLTARKRIEERLHFLAHYDPLTTLPNRILFSDRLDQAIVRARHDNQSVALFFLDLDRFKLINESIGHAAGDELLKEVANRLRRQVSETDGVFRLGGDHFAVFIAGLRSAQEAAAWGERLKATLHTHFVCGGQEIHLSASIGVALAPQDGHDAELLSRNAEAAMYRAIADGGNTIRFFSQDMNDQAAVRVRIEGRLHRALERGEFAVYFQPFVAAQSGRLLGAEALLRWQHHYDDTPTSPALFIPLLEETGLIGEVGEWALRRALEEASRWPSGEDAPFVAVNFSAVQLAAPHLVRKVAQALAEYDFPPNRLEIELTESAMMRDPEHGIRLLHELKDLGVRLSIDDFGTGYSSLSYLKQLPVDTLKIDRSFVLDAPGQEDATAIARTVIAMGHSLGLHVIAEGVENSEQLTFLREAGVDILQGYLFAKPLPPAEMRSLFEIAEPHWKAHFRSLRIVSMKRKQLANVGS